MKRLFFTFLFFFVISCGGVEFVYKNEKNLINPLYQKTKVITSGTDLSFMNSYLQMFFGEIDKLTYTLKINVKEKKTKRSVETNQATSNLRYELRFYYTLTSIIKDCITYEKEIVSYFSIIPKSSGYNYGTDTSLEKKYELAINENLNQFVSILSDKKIDNCK
ncbi:hypothetical protein OA415_01855 [Pelagibacteraceae bacterium]|nr:hypothetical protein [Pelagibacteraceae bacterium]